MIHAVYIVHLISSQLMNMNQSNMTEVNIPGCEALAVGVAVRAGHAQESPGVVVVVALPAVRLAVAKADPEVLRSTSNTLNNTR